MQIFANDIIVVMEGAGLEGQEGKEMGRNLTGNSGKYTDCKFLNSPCLLS